jgi:hypothetical protein
MTIDDAPDQRFQAEPVIRAYPELRCNVGLAGRLPARVNPAYVQVMGYEAEELLHQPSWTSSTPLTAGALCRPFPRWPRVGDNWFRKSLSGLRWLDGRALLELHVAPGA